MKGSTSGEEHLEKGNDFGDDTLDAGDSSPTAENNAVSNRSMEVPASIRKLSAAERAEIEKKLVRKIDFRLLPMIILMYIMNYLDRNNIASAKLQGLEQDLNLSSSQYDTCVSILFVGYILMQIPSNLFLNKIGRPAIYLPSVMVVWGAISALTATTQNFTGLVLVRFFLGFVEAAYFPGCLLFLSMWYTRKELAFRTALMYSGSLISGAFGGLIAAGILSNMNGAQGIAAWRWLFIIEGSITITVALLALLVLPNFPTTTKWLSDTERDLAVWRLQEDIGTADWVSATDQKLSDGFKLAFRDSKLYILGFLLLGFVSCGSVTNFFPSVVKTLGYNDVDSLLLTAPPYVLAVITTFLNAWHADRTGERFLHITLPLIVCLVVFILAATTTATAPRFVAMMLMPASVYSGYVVALAWISNTIPRPPSKRAAALAAINAFSNASQIYASYLYKDDWAPRYWQAMTLNCVTALISFSMAVLLRTVLVRLNKKLDRGEKVDGAATGAGEGNEEAEEKGFRFLT